MKVVWFIGVDEGLMGNLIFFLIYVNVATNTMISQPHLTKCFLHDAFSRAQKIQRCTKTAKKQVGSCPEFVWIPPDTKMRAQNFEGP